MPRFPRPRRAFARVELVALMVIAVVATALGLAAADRSRRAAMSYGSLANLQWFAAATAAYAADSGDRFWGFSWKKDVKYGDWVASTDNQAHANQAVDILRRRADPAMPTVPTWFPALLYSPLPLYDYLDAQFPCLRGVSPGDRWRLAWAKDRDAFLAGEFLPYQPDPAKAGRRWPYSSSYQLPPALYDHSPPPSRLEQVGQHNLFAVPSTGMLGQFALGDVAHPSEKVHLHDAAAWEWERPAFFGYPEARVTLLHCDGSAGIRAARDANPGWQPNKPGGTDPSTYKYAPSPWEAPLLDGESNILVGRYRWTRGGIKGRDFGGPEAAWPK